MTLNRIFLIGCLMALSLQGQAQDHDEFPKAAQKQFEQYEKARHNNKGTLLEITGKDLEGDPSAVPEAFNISPDERNFAVLFRTMSSGFWVGVWNINTQKLARKARIEEPTWMSMEGERTTQGIYGLEYKKDGNCLLVTVNASKASVLCDESNINPLTNKTRVEESFHEVTAKYEVTIVSGRLSINPIGTRKVVHQMKFRNSDFDYGAAIATNAAVEVRVVHGEEFWDIYCDELSEFFCRWYSRGKVLLVNLETGKVKTVHHDVPRGQQDRGINEQYCLRISRDGTFYALFENKTAVLYKLPRLARQ